MKNKLLLVIISIVSSIAVSSLQAQSLNAEVFDLLDLNYKGLEQVKTHLEAGDNLAAADALLIYYKNRTHIHHPDINLKMIDLSEKEQVWADEGLEHKFFAHKGYQPSYFYGEDIRWDFWPIQDNELRWQLHRHKWWSPMGKAYRLSHNEKYVQEWIFQYLDWIKKNPLIDENKLNPTDQEKKTIENMRFAWRPLEVSHRLEDQTRQFVYFNTSENFTSAFLTVFLANYHRHAEHILRHYSKQGNHLLFEAQRMIYAGVFFPEFKDAAKWRKSGMTILGEEIKKQVYEDGMQYELDPHYHLASINIFYKALKMADINGFKNEFTQDYRRTLEKMTDIVYNMSFPDYTMPCFGDAKAVNKKEMIKHYKRWQKIFPNNQALAYFATTGKEGSSPSYLSKDYRQSGYYIFRNGWQADATVMVFKAGPPAFWHNQPDNGTFELYVKGRNFFPDAGSYVYGGNEKVLKERNWFRQTMVHKTLTLDNQNIETTDSKLLLWDISTKNMQKMVVENQSYKNLKHQRALFFIDETFFVIFDRAVGAALGAVGIHYQLAEGNAMFNKNNFSVNTSYSDKNNIMVKAFGDNSMELKEEEGWVSYNYRQKSKRPAFVFESNKKDDKPVRFLTVLVPYSTDKPEVSAIILPSEENEVEIELKMNNKKYTLYASW